VENALVVSFVFSFSFERERKREDRLLKIGRPCYLNENVLKGRDRDGG